MIDWYLEKISGRLQVHKSIESIITVYMTENSLFFTILTVK